MRTYFNVYNKETSYSKLLKEVSIAVSGGLLLGLLSQISFRLFFSPIPISTQTMWVLLISLFAGKKRSMNIILTYLFLGACGVPVFACGLGGIASFAGPTGGYLIGFLLSAILFNKLSCMTFKGSLLIKLSLSSMLIYLTGFLHLSMFVGMHKAFLYGIKPFVLIDTCKIIICIGLQKTFSLKSKKNN